MRNASTMSATPWINSSTPKTIGALQGMVAALALQVMMREAAQLVVDQRHERFESLPVPFAPTH